MSLVYMDGLDCYETLADAQAAGWSVTGSPTLNTTGGRNGGGALVMATNTDVLSPAIPSYAFLDRLTYGFSLYLTAFPSIATDLVRFIGGASTTISSLVISSAGVLSFTSQNSTNYGSSALSLNTWYRVEVSITYGNSNTTGQLDVHVNGVSVFTGTNIDTFTTAATPNAFEFRSGSSLRYRIDDVTVTFDDAVVPDTFMGDVVIENLRPNADGTHTAWTANTGTDWEAVDDPLGSADNDTTYIAATTAADKSSFALTNVVGTADDNFGVQIRAKIRKTDAGGKTVRGFLRSGTAEDNGVTVGPLETYGWLRMGIFVDDPNTSAALSDTIINGLEAGVEVIT